MSFNSKNLISLVQVSIQNRASDIHLRSMESPALRVDGILHRVQSNILQIEDMLDLVKILAKDKINLLNNKQDIDGSFEIKNLCRLRYNIFKYLGSNIGITLRIIKSEIPSFKSLGLPITLKEIASKNRGLNLITGPTGSGKSSTLAAMINYININFKKHIITIEDPIEFIYSQKNSRITQREIGQDVLSYNQALKSALRQDPDVILIGEMRDIETVSMCLKAAETGHCVFSTIHTTNVTSTIGRLISLFPSSEQDEVKKRLAYSLESIVSQRLIKKTQTGMTPALEIMLTNPGIKDCILGKEPLSSINRIIEKGHLKEGVGSQSFDQHLLELFKHNIISQETALESATSEVNILQKMNFDK